MKRRSKKKEEEDEEEEEEEEEEQKSRKLGLNYFTYFPLSLTFLPFFTTKLNEERTRKTNERKGERSTKQICEGEKKERKEKSFTIDKQGAWSLALPYLSPLPATTSSSRTKVGGSLPPSFAAFTGSS